MHAVHSPWKTPVTLRLFRREELTLIEYFMAPRSCFARALRAGEGGLQQSADFARQDPESSRRGCMKDPRMAARTLRNSCMIVRVFWPEPLLTSAPDAGLLVGWYLGPLQSSRSTAEGVDIVVAGRADCSPASEQPAAALSR